MATTFEPAEESAFSVRVLGGTIRLALLETQTMLLLDPFLTLNASQKLSPQDSTGAQGGAAQYEPVFMQLADDHK
jgi:calpain-9